MRSPKEGFLIVEETENSIKLLAKVKFSDSRKFAYIHLPYALMKDKFDNSIVTIEIKKARFEK